MTVKISEMTATFTDGGTDYDAIGMDITDTASGANSNMINLKKGGSSMFNVRKDGTAFANNVRSNTVVTLTLTANLINANVISGNTLSMTSITGTNITGTNIAANSLTVASPLSVADLTVSTTLVIPSGTPTTGKQGEIKWDVNSVYICVATNTWKKVAIT